VPAKGLENWWEIRIPGFGTYLLGVSWQELLSFLRLQSKTAPNGWKIGQSIKEQFFHCVCFSPFPRHLRENILDPRQNEPSSMAVLSKSFSKAIRQTTQIKDYFRETTK
jgi:hypothetical protein